MCIYKIIRVVSLVREFHQIIFSSYLQATASHLVGYKPKHNHYGIDCLKVYNGQFSSLHHSLTFIVYLPIITHYFGPFEDTCQVLRFQDMPLFALP